MIRASWLHMISDKESPPDRSINSEETPGGKDPKTEEIAPELPSVAEGTAALPSTTNPDTHRLVWVLLRGWWIILIVLIIAVVYSGYSLTTHSPVYTSYMVVREIDQSPLVMPARIAGLAEGLGVNIPKAKNTVFDDFKVLLGMDRLAQELDQKFGYVRKVYGGRGDEESQSWIAPTGWRVDLDDYFRGFAPIAEWTPPNTQQLAGYIAGNILLFELEDSDAVRIQFQHEDASFSYRFLSDVYRTAEELLREQELERISARISYVKKSLASVTITEYRESLIFVLAEQEKKALELQSGQPYIAEIIQPPIGSNIPSSPNILVRLILGVIVGLVLGAVLAVFIAFLRSVVAHKPLPRRSR